MKKIIYLSALVFMASCLCFEACSESPADNCTKDVKDPRGKMKPWKKLITTSLKGLTGSILRWATQRHILLT